MIVISLQSSGIPWSIAPDYLCELITKHHAVKALRSNDMMLLDEPKYGVKRMAQERLSIRPHMNIISYHLFIRKSINLSTFNLVLNLFKLAFLAS